jgi:hypothetical protein
MTAENDCADDMAGTLAAITNPCPAGERFVSCSGQPPVWPMYTHEEIDVFLRAVRDLAEGVDTSTHPVH